MAGLIEWFIDYTFSFNQTPSGQERNFFSCVPVLTHSRPITLSGCLSRSSPIPIGVLKLCLNIVLLAGHYLVLCPKMDKRVALRTKIRGNKLPTEDLQSHRSSFSSSVFTGLKKATRCSSEHCIRKIENVWRFPARITEWTVRKRPTATLYQRCTFTTH